MNRYIVFLIQLMIWSSYSLTNWLVGKEHFLSKALLLIVFIYLAFIIAKRWIGLSRISWVVTVSSLGAYSLIQLFLHYLFL